jgi:O-antigen/teichoic acid export membrane protein
MEEATPGTRAEPAGVGSEAAAATSGASVVRGGFWSAGANVAPQLFALAISIEGARFLGAAGLGRQSFIAFVIAVTQNVLPFGLPIALMRTVGEAVGADRRAEARGLVDWGWRIGAAASVGSFALLFTVALLGAQPRSAWILAALTAAAGTVTSIPGAALMGLQRWRDLSVTIIAANAAGAVVTIVVLALGGGVTGMIGVQLGVAVAILVVVSLAARRRLAALAPAAADPGPLKRSTLTYAGSALAGLLITFVVFRRSEFFFLQHYANDREIAFYSVAFAAVTTLVLVPQALAGVVPPAVATLLGARQHERIRSGYSRALRLLLLAALPVMAGAAALGPETLKLLFGPAFGATRTPLLVLLLPFPLIPLMNVSYALVVGLGRIRFPLVAGATSALLNVALDFALIPHHGAVGAAIANSCAQAATAVATVVYANRLVGPVRLAPRTLIPAVLASAGAGCVAWGLLELLGGAAGVVAGVVAGAATFLAVAVALPILSRDDADWFENAFGGRIGALARRLA